LPPQTNCPLTSIAFTSVKLLPLAPQPPNGYLPALELILRPPVFDRGGGPG